MNWVVSGRLSWQSEDGNYSVSVYPPSPKCPNWMATAWLRPEKGARVFTVIGDIEMAQTRPQAERLAMKICQNHAHSSRMVA